MNDAQNPVAPTPVSTPVQPEPVVVDTQPGAVVSTAQAVSAPVPGPDPIAAPTPVDAPVEIAPAPIPVDQVVTNVNVELPQLTPAMEKPVVEIPVVTETPAPLEPTV